MLSLVRNQRSTFPEPSFYRHSNTFLHLLPSVNSVRLSLNDHFTNKAIHFAFPDRNHFTSKAINFSAFFRPWSAFDSHRTIILQTTPHLDDSSYRPLAFSALLYLRWISRNGSWFLSEKTKGNENHDNLVREYIITSSSCWSTTGTAAA